MDNNSFDSIDDECSHLSHEWDTSEIHILFFDFSRELIQHLKSYLERRFVIQILALTVKD